jgi:diacylglycerol kinase (ATP)
VRDRNLRIHLSLGVLAGTFSAVAPLAPAERAILLVCVAAVIAAEAANTAVEAIVDLVSPEWNERARIAKDAAAAAVLVLAAGSVLAFLAIVLGRWDALVEAWPALRGPALNAATLALVAGLLPWRNPRISADADGVLGVAFGAFAVFGVLGVARVAASQAGTAAVAACVAVAISGARRKRRLEPGAGAT